METVTASFYESRSMEQHLTRANRAQAAEANASKARG